MKNKIRKGARQLHIVYYHGSGQSFPTIDGRAVWSVKNKALREAERLQKLQGEVYTVVTYSRNVD